MPASSQKYSRRPGKSLYPIRPGAIFRLKEPILDINYGAGGLQIKHHVYIWINAVWPIQEGKQPKKRKVSFIRMIVPVDQQFKKHWGTPVKSVVQFEYIGRILFREGYTEIGKVEWDPSYRRKSFREFYKKIGLI